MSLIQPRAVSFDHDEADLLMDTVNDLSPSPQGATRSSSADELQALHTALCFLASINAQVEEFQAYLRAHPQALLLEGTSPIQQESARYMVHHSACHCSSDLCRENRCSILRLLDQGFCECDMDRWCHQADVAIEGRDDKSNSNQDQIALVRPIPDQALRKLTHWEEKIRLWRHREFALRAEWRDWQDSLEENTQTLQNHRHHTTSAFSKWNCSTNKHHTEWETDMEDQVLHASQRLRSVQEEHHEVLSNIRRGRRRQFSILSKIFAPCKRQTCEAMDKQNERIGYDV